MSGEAGLCPDVVLKRLNNGVSGDAQPAAEVIPDGDAAFIAGLHDPEESIPAVTPGFAACPGTGFASCDVTTDIVFGAIGVKRDLWPIRHSQQFGLVRVQTLQKPVERGNASASKEDAIEPGVQCGGPALGWLRAVGLEVSVEVPDQAAHLCLGVTAAVIESIQLVHQTLGVNPAQRMMMSDIELPGIVAQHHRITQEPVRLDAAPQGSLGGDLDRVEL